LIFHVVEAEAVSELVGNFLTQWVGVEQGVVDRWVTSPPEAFVSRAWHGGVRNDIEKGSSALSALSSNGVDADGPVDALSSGSAVVGVDVQLDLHLNSLRLIVVANVDSLIGGETVRFFDGEPLIAVPLEAVSTLKVQVVHVSLIWEVGCRTSDWNVVDTETASVLSEVELINGDLSFGSHQLLRDNVVLVGIVEANVTGGLGLVESRHDWEGCTFGLNNTGIEISRAVQPDLASDSVDTTGGNGAVNIEWVVVIRSHKARVWRRGDWETSA